MANITRKWHRFMALSCSHGEYADPACLRAVLDFKQRWKPKTTLHLGDAFDFRVLRANASAADECGEMDGDLTSGVEFLKALRPNVFFYGNHEDRLRTLMGHPRAIVSGLACRVNSQITDVCQRQKTEVVQYHQKTGWRQYGSALFGHGYYHGAQALRDTIESHTSQHTVIGHLHRVQHLAGRRSDNPQGYCVGWLGSEMDYSKNRRETLTWARGWAWGEYCDNASIIWLARETTPGEFRLPV